MNSISTCSDHELVARASGGCRDAVREIVNRYQGKLLSFLIKLGGSGSDSEDILQETFITTFDRLDSYDRSRPFSAWIFGIARHKAGENFRKSLRISKLKERGAIEDVLHETPSDHLDQKEQSNLFWNRARRLLNDDQFSSLWLHYQEDIGIAEIAITLGKTEGNVKILLFRARKILFDFHNSNSAKH